jgi:hypothetical protein
MHYSLQTEGLQQKMKGYEEAGLSKALPFFVVQKDY